jgi:4-amino-4-deoxy-L-arabinose transferase-like glycosyltransferase
VGALFTFAAAGALAAGVCRLRSRSQGLLAGMVLLGTKAFVNLGAAQYADVPLAFFILATVLLLGLDDASERSSRGLLLLAGLSAGLAAWTKNEGLLFLVVVLIARCIVARRRSSGRQALGQLALLLAGAAPALGVVILFKLSLAANNDLVSGQSWQASLPRLADPWRYWLIVKALVFNVVALAKAYVLVLPLCFFLLGRAPQRPRLALLGMVSVLLMMLVGYFFIYVTTPLELAGHLRTSIDRLLLQLWPAAILAIFLSLSDPVQLLAETPA